jgi:type I restriction-modification system DNA methylase subunit
MHFNKVPLRRQDFEFPDLLGTAYEYLIRDFADSAGKEGGEFYTPRDVVPSRCRSLTHGLASVSMIRALARAAC